MQSEAERLLGPAVDPLYMEPGEGAGALAPAEEQDLVRWAERNLPCAMPALPLHRAAVSVV